MHLTSVFAALLIAAPCFSSPLPQADPPASPDACSTEVKGPPWPEVYLEPLDPPKDIRVFTCPFFNDDCAALGPANLVDGHVDETKISSSKSKRALCKYENDLQQWFIKQWEGWYMSEEDIHIKGMAPGARLNEVKDLPHCLAGKVGVKYKDYADNSDEDSATPGGCMQRKIHKTFFVSRDLREFESIRQWKMNSNPAIYPTSWCRVFADEHCKEPVKAVTDLPTITQHHLDAGIAIQDEEARENEQNRFAEAKSFQCF